MFNPSVFLSALPTLSDLIGPINLGNLTPGISLTSGIFGPLGPTLNGVGLDLGNFLSNELVNGITLSNVVGSVTGLFQDFRLSYGAPNRKAQFTDMVKALEYAFGIEIDRGAIAAAHRRFGTTALLPTLISDTPEKMRAARDAVGEAMRANPSVLGIHFEGPFLSSERAGVHDARMFRPPEAGDVELLSGARFTAFDAELAQFKGNIPETPPVGRLDHFVEIKARYLGKVAALGHHQLDDAGSVRGPDPFPPAAQHFAQHAEQRHLAL